MPALKPSLVPSKLGFSGIALVDREQALQDNVILRWDKCGAVWSCNSRLGGHLPPR
ncbi:MAG: hypothetical protein ACYC6L_03580 [Anaerolineae bacterium]